MAKKHCVKAIISTALIMLPTTSMSSTPPKFGAITEFNYIFQDSVEAVKKRWGSFNFERFGLRVDGDIEPFDYSGEYTWYPYMHTLMHAWIGYNYSETIRFQLGVTDVPFGLQPYSFNNWWGDVLFFTGLNTNKKSGISMQYGELNGWTLHAAIFKNDVFGDNTGVSNNSYYYNLTGSQQEVGQANIRLVKKFDLCPTADIELGLSAQGGKLQNTNTHRIGNSTAFAAHSIINYNHFNLQLQETFYTYKPQDEVLDGIITLGAYTDTHTAPSKGIIHTVNLSFAPDWQCNHVGSWTFYNDYSILPRSRKAVKESVLNTLGFSFGIGDHVFIYNDFIFAKNMPYIGVTGVNNIGANDSHLAGSFGFRYNLNIGVSL